MKAVIEIEDKVVTALEEPAVGDHGDPLVLGGPVRSGTADSFAGMVVGDLIGIREDGRVPLVVFPGQLGAAAVAARSVIDLHGRHVGRQVALMFDGGDPAKPIVIGVLREGDEGSSAVKIGQTEVAADGERLVVTAKHQLVLRCGRASITLTKEGKVVIQGTFVSSQSSGVNRIKGGSVQIN
jgi:Domain of unknown function (DUF6484)